jgi:hypothetical protein
MLLGRRRDAKHAQVVLALIPKCHVPAARVDRLPTRSGTRGKKGGSKEELGREESRGHGILVQFIHDRISTTLVCYIDRPTDGLSPLIPTGNERRSWAGRRKNGKGTRRCIGSEQVDVCVGCILALCIDSTVYEDGYIGRRSVRRFRSH